MDTCDKYVYDIKLFNDTTMSMYNKGSRNCNSLGRK